MMESGVEEDLLASLRLSDPQEMVDEEAVQAAAELKKLQNREKFLAERQAMQLKMAEKKILEEAERITNNPPAPPPTPTPTQTQTPTPTQTSTISSSSSPSLSPSSIYHTPTPLPFSSVLVDGCEQRKVGGFFGKTSFWVYKIVVNNQSFVVRRFRDIVALERRIREDVPGIILPPFPDKHSSRAMEEGHITQSFEFAQTRAGEISQYLQLLVAHPVTNSSQALKTFLTLQDDIGTAWPEVSTSTITRLTASASSSASSALSSTSSTLSSMNRNELTDSDPRMLSAVSDQLEIVTAIQQAVPKLESAAVHFREHSEVMGIVGERAKYCERAFWKTRIRATTKPTHSIRFRTFFARRRYGASEAREGHEQGPASQRNAANTNSQWRRSQGRPKNEARRRRGGSSNGPLHPPVQARGDHEGGHT